MKHEEPAASPPTVDEIRKSKAERWKERPVVGRFRVLVGKHSEGGIIYGKGTDAGDVLDSKSDLLKLNTPAGKKFEKLKSRGEPVKKPVVQEPPPEEVEDVDDEVVDDGLEDLTIPNLQELAENEEIEISGVHRKADIIDMIRTTRAGRG